MCRTDAAVHPFHTIFMSYQFIKYPNSSVSFNSLDRHNLAFLNPKHGEATLYTVIYIGVNSYCEPWPSNGLTYSLLHSTVSTFAGLCCTQAWGPAGTFLCLQMKIVIFEKFWRYSHGIITYFHSVHVAGQKCRYKVTEFINLQALSA